MVEKYILKNKKHYQSAPNYRPVGFSDEININDDLQTSACCSEVRISIKIENPVKM